MELLHSGKIRDVYLDGDDVILVASDRISVYDVVLPTEIPDKGKILTQLSLWWFNQLADVVSNHVISATDVPLQWAGRAIRCRRLEMIPVECIARGYLVGLGLEQYKQFGSVSGVPLPAGLTEGTHLSAPIFTPTTKGLLTQHDEFITFDDVVAEVGGVNAQALRDITLEVYRRGAAVAYERGVIIADTKLEFGYASDTALVLGDELLTSDSSRFWLAEEWRPGQPQRAMDKQFVRDWAASADWNKTSPGPELPCEIVEATRARYIEAYERITGTHWE